MNNTPPKQPDAAMELADRITFLLTNPLATTPLPGDIAKIIRAHDAKLQSTITKQAKVIETAAEYLCHGVACPACHEVACPSPFKLCDCGFAELLTAIEQLKENSK